MTRLLLVAAVALGACSANEVDGTSNVTADAPDRLDNTWYQAEAELRPLTDDADSFLVGDVAPNFLLNDQFNDPVELHQFAGKAVLLEVMPDHGEEVVTLIEGECAS